MSGKSGDENAAARSPARAAWSGCAISQYAGASCFCVRSTAAQAETACPAPSAVSFCVSGWRIMGRSPPSVSDAPGPAPVQLRRGPRCAGWGFAHPFQKLFQNGGVVEFRVSGSEQQGQFLTIVSKVVQLFQSLSSFRTFEFLQVTLAKRGSLLWVGMKPFAQTIGGS